MVERRVERPGFRPRAWRYRWNALDRLVGCEGPGGDVWRYGHDPFGRRLWKRRGDGVGRAYLWDGDVVAAEGPLGPDGSAVPSGEVVWHHEPGTFRPLARQAGGTLLHVVTDHLGTPRELHDGEGRRVWARHHRVWGGDRGAEEVGAVAASEGDGPCPIGFPGQWRDWETRLAYNRYRHCDLDTGQYVTSDPIGLLGGWRPNGYVISPTYGVDPLGLIDPSYRGAGGGGYTIYGIQGRGSSNPTYIGITDNTDVRTLQHTSSGRIDGSQEMIELDHADTYGQARGYEQAYAEHYNTIDTSRRGKSKNPGEPNHQNPFNTDRTDPRGRIYNDAYQAKKSQLDGAP